MAKYKSQILTQASGSVGGLTFSHGAGGLVLRGRAIPVNTRSTLQSCVRAAVGSMAVLWQNLTVDQRNAWNAYADAVPLVNSMGDPIYVSGLNMFIRANVVRATKHATSSIVKDGPTVLSLAATPILSSLTLVVSAAGVLTVGLTLYQSDAPVVADVNNFLFLFATGPKSPGRDYIGGPYHYGNSDVEANAAGQPQNFSKVVPGYYSPDGGQKVGLQVRASKSDGRLSARSSIYGLTTAAP